VNCPNPEMQGMDIHGRQIGPDILAVGSLIWQDDPGQWVCLADVVGMLCRVAVKVTPVPQDAAP
jgi:hypothetical protein